MNVIKLADSVEKQCEKLLEKRNSYYQAHLLKAELDQVISRSQQYTNSVSASSFYLRDS